MKILLTGNKGYLGSRLQEYLTARGHAVMGIGRQEDIGKITREMLLEGQIELVVNSATVANRIDRRYAIGGGDEAVNVLGVRNLVYALKSTDIGLIHLSTKDVYGEVYGPDDVREMDGRLMPEFTINERQPFRPGTIYAKTKLMGEFVAESHSKTTILRLSSVYTTYPHTRGNWILHFCRAAKSGSTVWIDGSGKQLRDPLHVDDLGALILQVQAKKAWGLTFNVGGGLKAAYSIIEVLDIINPRLKRETRDGGDHGYVTDIALAKKVCDWEPRFSLPTQLQILKERVNAE